MHYDGHDTIAALATAPGVGAVAIVRMSGENALEIAARLTGRRPAPRRAELCRFRAASGEVIDRGLVLYFPAPASYTGEDMIELQTHGGAVISDWLLETLHALGARPAEAGEFTLRAFLNDKLDLTQAEAVADLIESRSRQASQAALRSLGGRFSDQVHALQAALTELRVFIEAWLDFPDEELDLGAQQELADRAAAAERLLATLRSQAAQGAALADGLSIAIAGPPNAGKSSLLNCLAGYDAAIVTDIPGTTRDTLKEQLLLDNLPVHIVDTAGLRTSLDPIEAEGVRRARVEAGKADHVLWVGDIRDGIDTISQAAHEALGEAAQYTLIANKIDLVEAPASRSEHRGREVIALSALRQTGMDLLIARLKTLAGLSGEVEGALSARRRHLDALDQVAARLGAARQAFEFGLELAAEELRAAQRSLSELTGELSSDDLLGEIFSSFCIGK
jgi:tRNA modification GTPase